MSTIKVTPEQLHHVSSQVDQARQQLEHIQDNLSRQIMLLQAMWMGVTQERFYDDFERSRPVLQKALESMVYTSKELKDIATRFENADAEKGSLGGVIGAVGAAAIGYVEEPGEDIHALQIKAFENRIHPFTGEPVSDKYAQIMLTSLKFSQIVMAFQMVRGSMPGRKGPFRLPASDPAVAKIKKNLEAAEARKGNDKKEGAGVTGQSLDIGEVKLKPIGIKGEGDALKRTFEIEGRKVEINSGHGYRGSGHRTGNAQDIGTMDQIESVILKDMELANKTDIAIPRPPKTIERIIQVNEKTMGYTVTQTPDGTLRVSTYYPK